MIGINPAPWMEAIESQIDALTLVKLFLIQAPSRLRDMKSWNVDHRLLSQATPFSWNTEVAAAVMEAGKSIPLDTPLNKWNLDSEAAWWHFETPLPFQTVDDEKLGVRALCFGWVPISAADFGMPICCWTDCDLDGLGLTTIKPRVLPSQTFEWEHNITLGEMLSRTRQYHDERYGPDGPDRFRPQVGVGVFMSATESCARFLLAGLAWLNQRVLIEERGHVERHRRKEYERKVRPIDSVRVVHLRRASYAETPVDAEGTPVNWTCRWVVGGHWRNQSCGPAHSDRKLTWIPPYMKGPDGMPLKQSRQKVYKVDR